MIENQLQSTIWSLTEEKSWEWNPSVYNVSEGFASILNENYDTLPKRLHSFYVKMGNIPAYYEAAKAKIKNPTLEHTQLAIEQNQGGLSVFETDLNAAMDKAKLTRVEREKFEARAMQAKKAINDYATWLKNMKNMVKLRLHTT